ncbi:hypothetical protein KC887_08795 [Candidatus Kaiserbacteria bacterium]|nr:hypothetical protein [Candidatus Kaiserbacteria bacterium]
MQHPYFTRRKTRKNDVFPSVHQSNIFYDSNLDRDLSEIEDTIEVNEVYTPILQSFEIQERKNSESKDKSAGTLGEERAILKPNEPGKRIFIVVKENMILEPQKHTKIPVVFSENLPSESTSKKTSYLVYASEAIQQITKNRCPILTNAITLMQSGFPVHDTGRP